ncbi:hypothetical protein B5S31_g4718 [[Candida] boidinii]|uniref:Unnamed protein product n=1 Tax=Candida boidinii TaxID=5477 RepID=A0ACB5TNE6_CANBO|nr:hypothetical protein B5S29_g4718 [[Candida] boidinii]OWB74886.1 hypothetical protein B5S31_g4718 [[Candida] boidinii]OWB80422.1 hypothetical protein B5S32_g4698 [[Candida] boidinii]GME70150.1 unnamed protein product [[Candida] boidinii]GME92168.1 unnamed protein product [[Candida] boidinii]
MSILLELPIRDTVPAINYYDFIPSLAGNGVYLALFSLLLILQIGLGIYTKQWWFGICYVCGLILEVLGYIARVDGHFDQSNRNLYILQIIGLTISPCFFMAGIYYVFGKIATIYGSQYSRLRPMQYSAFFITFDVIAVFVQGAGGGIASSASSTNGDPWPGTWIMVAGLAIQVFSMTVFLFFWFDFLYSLRTARKHGSEREVFEERYYEIRHNKLFVPFLYFYTAATFFVYIRSAYRVAELSEGWTGYLITNEVYVFVLDGMMIALATVLLTIIHPGIAFGKDAYIPVRGMKLGRKKHIDEQYELKEDDNNNSENNEIYEEGGEGNNNNMNNNADIYRLKNDSSGERSLV